MVINIGTRVATVNSDFSTSRIAALIESKMLQYTTLSSELHHCTSSDLETQIVLLSDVLVCLSIHCEDQKQHSNPDILIKSFNNMLKTCVETAFEYLQAYTRGAGVKNKFCYSLHPCECAGYTMFLLACFLWLTFSKLKSIFLNSIRSKQYRNA